MKKVIAGLMIAASMLTFGCGGRNAEFGTVDMKQVEAEAPIMKTTQEDFTKKMGTFTVSNNWELQVR